MTANIRPGDVVTVGADRTPCRVLTFRLLPGGAVATVRPVGGGSVATARVESLRREKVTT